MNWKPFRMSIIQKKVLLLLILILFFFVLSYYWKTAPISTKIEEDFVLDDDFTSFVEHEKNNNPAMIFYEDMNIKLAREYQIDLSKTLWSSNRDQHVADFLHFFKTASNGLFDIKPEDMLEEGYHRYSYSITHFKGPVPTIRLRDFTRGHRAGLTTVDLKFRNGDTMMDMFALDATPAQQYLETAVQKVEQDVHACDVRWSRGTRLFLDHSPTIDTVEDVRQLFPSLIENSGSTVEKNQIKKQSMDVYYWQSSYRSSLENGLEYKITFTFMYSSIESAFAGNAMPKKDGEFSLRLFAAKNGHSRKFRTIDLKIADDLFEELLWSDWNVDPDMECLLDPERDPEEAEVWRLPIV